jgi:hypothetical protein
MTCFRPVFRPTEEKAMNRLINIVAKSRFLKGDIGYHLVRASMVIIFVLFGYERWLPGGQSSHARNPGRGASRRVARI